MCTLVRGYVTFQPALASLIICSEKVQFSKSLDCLRRMFWHLTAYQTCIKARSFLIIQLHGSVSDSAIFQNRQIVKFIWIFVWSGLNDKFIHGCIHDDQTEKKATRKRWNKEDYCYKCSFNLMRLSDAYMRTLTIIGADNGLAPTRRQCWNIVNWAAPGNNLQWTSNQNSYIFIRENPFENVICETAIILSRGRWVKTILRLFLGVYILHFYIQWGFYWVDT